MAEIDEIRAAAQRIANWQLLDCEFGAVYEDEDLADWSGDDWRAVHDLITSAKATLPPPKRWQGLGPDDGEDRVVRTR